MQQIRNQIPHKLMSSENRTIATKNRLFSSRQNPTVRWRQSNCGTIFELSKIESHCPNLNIINLTQAIIDCLFTFSALMSNMYSLVSALELSENQLISFNLVEAEKICENGKWCI